MFFKLNLSLFKKITGMTMKQNAIFIEKKTGIKLLIIINSKYTKKIKINKNPINLELKIIHFYSDLQLKTRISQADFWKLLDAKKYPLFKHFKDQTPALVPLTYAIVGFRQ